MSSTARTHLIVVGLVIFVGGTVAKLVFPAFPFTWIAVAVIALAHVGLIMTAAGTVAEAAARRRSRHD